MSDIMLGPDDTYFKKNLCSERIKLKLKLTGAF